MAFDLTKNMVLHEIGKGYLMTKSGAFNEITYGQKTTFDITSTLVDVEGGDSLFPIYTFISKKAGSVTIDAATFNLSQAAVTNVANITTTGLKKLNRLLVASTASSLGTYTGVSDVIAVGPDGNTVAVTQTGTAAAADEIDISDTGAIIWGTGVVAGEYIIWFKSDAPSESASMGLLKNAMPEVSELHWTIKGAELDGDYYQVDIEAPRVRADGTFKIDVAKGTATVPQLKFNILDPGDGSNDFMKITVSKIEA